LEKGRSKCWPETRSSESFDPIMSGSCFNGIQSLPFVALYWCEIENVSANVPSVKHKGPALASTYLRHHSHSLINVKLTLAGSVGIPDGHPISRHTIKYTLDPITYRPVYVGFDSASETVASPGPSEATLCLPIAGSPLGSIASPVQFATSSSTPQSYDSGVELDRVFVSGTAELIDPLPLHLAQGLDGRGFKDIPRAAAVLPISSQASQNRGRGDGRSLPCAILLLGLNTRRAYDADYAAWLESVGAGLSNQLTVVLQREADMRIIEEQERMDKAKTMFFTNVSHGKQMFVYRVVMQSNC
jgi:hypothetical protein